MTYKPSFTHTVLAMDLSLSSPGFAVLALEHNGREYVPIVLESSVIKTDSKRSHGYRLSQIRAEIKRYIGSYKPDYYVRERGFSRFPTVTQTLFKVVGTTDVTVFENTGIEDIHEIAVTSVKKLVTGDGRASKDKVAEAVFERLQIENTDEYYTKGGKLIDDKTDALSVGIAYYIEKGFIRKK